MLGKWALIDIETTGIDPSREAIIDVGFLLFEGTELVQEYSSLVKTDIPLSHFIQNLTGIKPKLLANAPSWDRVLEDLEVLDGATLIAHNSDFEKQFLAEEFRSGRNRSRVCG